MYRLLLVAVLSGYLSYTAYVQLQGPVQASLQDFYLLRKFQFLLCTYISIAFTLFFLMAWHMKNGKPVMPGAHISE